MKPVRDQGPTISVITPTHNLKYIKDLYQSLTAQSHTAWEWVVVLNGGVTPEDFNAACYVDDDPRPIRLVETPPPKEGVEPPGVGALKRVACEHATGEIIVEVDHDDLLTPNALAEILKAFESHPDACFVYSNTALVDDDWKPLQWGADFGWETRKFVFRKRTLLETIAPAPEPQNLSRIWFAPDHVRAWRAKDYWEVGGHDPALKVADDHDLICRFYLHREMVHIDKCLYVYRVHNDKSNTWLENNQAVQDGMWANYNKYIFRLAERWADINGLDKIDLCGGVDKALGFTSIDLAGGDINADLNGPWPLADNSVGVIRASDAIEHLRDPIHTMNEAYRVLADGGFFLISVPSTDGRGAFQDPTHVSFWNQNSFWYYTKASHQKYLHGKAKCRFQAMKIVTWTPPGFCADNLIPYVEAHLFAVKSLKRKYHGALEV